METNVKFTDRESTPEQRQALINKARAWSVAQGATPSAEAEALYTRYVDGAITLEGITDALRAADMQRLSTTPLLVPANSPSLARAVAMQQERVSL